MTSQIAPPGSHRHAMSTLTPSPEGRTLREQAVHLTERLDRITAAAKVLRALVDEIRHDIPPEPMVALLDALDRDILLASQEIEQVRQRVAREMASMR